MNGVISKQAWAFQHELLAHPALEQLRREEKLPQAIAEGKDEWSKMVLLCRWTYNQFAPSAPKICPPWHASEILASIRSGESGGFCAQYAVVLVQSALALGWQARYLDVDAEPRAGGHVTVEVWSNQFNKWIVLDPHFGCFLQSGPSSEAPLSALEVHSLLAQGRKKEVKVVSVDGDQKLHPPIAADIRDFFYHLSVDMRNNHLSRPLNTWNLTETYLCWKDRHTQGRPGLFSRFTEDPRDFNFPLNQVEMTLQALPEPGRIACVFRTNMPGAAWLRIRRDGDPPRLLELVPGITPAHYDEIGSLDLGTPIPDLAKGSPQANAAHAPRLRVQYVSHLGFGLLLRHDLTLRPGKNILSFEAVNERGVRGPETRFELHCPSEEKDSR